MTDCLGEKYAICMAVQCWAFVVWKIREDRKGRNALVRRKWFAISYVCSGARISDRFLYGAQLQKPVFVAQFSIFVSTCYSSQGDLDPCHGAKPTTSYTVDLHMGDCRCLSDVAEVDGQTTEYTSISVYILPVVYISRRVR